MQEFADVTWADGQLWLASRYYIQNRTAADEAANRAIGAYRSLLAVTKNSRIQGRAHFGLGRIYELQNELDKAREEYGKVEGGFKVLAEQRIEQLEKPEVQDVYAWLANAQGPRRTAPAGPGTPGERPRFSPGEIALPDASGGETEPSVSIDDLFRGIGETSPTDGERYDEADSDATSDTAEAPANESKDEAPSDDAPPKE
jgi:hypothetical protein